MNSKIKYRSNFQCFYPDSMPWYAFLGRFFLSVVHLCASGNDLHHVPVVPNQDSERSLTLPFPFPQRTNVHVYAGMYDAQGQSQLLVKPWVLWGRNSTILKESCHFSTQALSVHPSFILPFYLVGFLFLGKKEGRVKESLFSGEKRRRERSINTQQRNGERGREVVAIESGSPRPWK